jgi:hypothetical protein
MTRLGTALVMAGGVAGLAGAGTAQAFGCGTVLAPPLNPVGGTQDNYLSGLAVVSACNIWTVGGYGLADGSSRTLIEQWTGGTNWTVVPSPNPGPSLNILHTMSAVSATNIWAVGKFIGAAGASGMFAHWDGSSWNKVDPPFSIRPLGGVATAPSGDVWAAEEDAFGSPGPLLHYDGSHWTRAALPSITPTPADGTIELGGMAATSASDVWAVGSYKIVGPPGRQTLILHWDGSQWSQSPSPTPSFQGSGSDLSAVSATSPADAWAVGTTERGERTTILHWDGHNWNPVPSQDPGSVSNELDNVAAVSPSSAFAVGSYSSDPPGPSRTLMLHWDGHGWSQVSSPNPGAAANIFTAVAPGAGGTVWAAGYKGDQNENRSLRTQIVEFGVVPNVIGDSEAVAADAILSAGLGTTTVDVPSGQGCSLDTNGKVIATSPGAGSFSGPPVTIKVCDLHVPVPNVMTFDDTSAQNSITAAGLMVGSVTKTPNCAVKAGDVVFQNPDAGTVVAAGSQVNLVEASGLGPNKKPCPVL